MEKLVQQYLFEYYYIKTSEVGNDGIYYKLNKNRWETPHSYYLLLKELNKVFGLEEELIKLIINDWVVSVKPDIDLKFYYTTTNELIGFPIVKSIAAQTIRMDLVDVQPMSAPRGELMYMDFQYDNNEPVVMTGNTGRRGPTNRNG